MLTHFTTLNINQITHIAATFYPEKPLNYNQSKFRELRTIKCCIIHL